MRRAFIERETFDAILAGSARLPKAVGKHFATVLRLQEGDEVELFDGEGRRAKAAFVAPDSLSNVELLPAVDEELSVVIVQARVRQAKLDEVAKRATELGATQIWIYDAERSQPGKVRLERLEKIAQQAARQSERAVVPNFLEMDFAGLLNALKTRPDSLAVAGVVGATKPFSELLIAPLEREVIAVLGPEGGLSEGETRALVEADVHLVKLGQNVLRTETAHVAVLSAIQVKLGYL